MSWREIPFISNDIWLGFIISCLLQTDFHHINNYFLLMAQYLVIHLKEKLNGNTNMVINNLFFKMNQIIGKFFVSFAAPTFVAKLCFMD